MSRLRGLQFIAARAARRKRDKMRLAPRRNFQTARLLVVMARLITDVAELACHSGASRFLYSPIERSFEQSLQRACVVEGQDRGTVHGMRSAVRDW
jgi:hypothetical protein